ncbi:MAG: SusC/RagA family TonB-linked outer membrane protein [Porphyromonas sp.]|nr:SusC/RagA family TonB-linked outer membrane protein [Porphyromonas sp.]
MMERLKQLLSVSLFSPSTRFQTRVSILLALVLLLQSTYYGGNVVQAQAGDTFSIKGTVLDDLGSPLAGVSVRLKEEGSIGTATDLDGQYVLERIPSKYKNGTLIFSYLGMKTQEVSISGRNTIDVKMAEDLEMLGEVVVTGYQEVKKERMTGSVTTINANNIKNLNIRRIDEVLIGNVSGLSAVQSGRPGSQASINIRGVNSLSGNTQPIWIIDGMPIQDASLPNVGTGTDLDQLLRQSGIGNIAPDDIASITVLKDAAASAIYGARAANGVIVIKTKKGQEGKPQYQLSLQQGISFAPRNNIRMMTTEEKIQFEREIYSDTNDPNVGQVANILSAIDMSLISKAEGERRIAQLAQNHTDWFRELYKPGYSTQIHGTLSGGSQNTQYYVSGNYLNEKGVEINSTFNRAIVMGKLTHEITDKLRAEGYLSATYREDGQSASVISPLRYAMYANPYETPDGKDLSWYTAKSSYRPGLLWQDLNAIQDLTDNKSTSRYLGATLNGRLTWDTPLEGLQLSVQGQGNFTTTNTRVTEAAGSYTNYRNNWLHSISDIAEVTPDMVLGALREGSFYSNAYTVRSTAEYNNTFNDDHILNLLLGNEIQASVMYSSYHYSPIFDELHRIVGIPSFPDGTTANSIISAISTLGSTGKYENKLSSFFLNGTYSYQDRYVLNGSVRYDGSDIIGNQNQFTPLWNVSAKWNLHNEAFYNAKNDILSQLSLRAGFGYTGSIDKNAFPFVILSYENSAMYGGQLVPDNFIYANPNIKWQTKQDFNIGFESSWFRDRLQLGVNYYHNFVYDLLDNRALPWSSGRDMVKENAGNLVNTGVEIDFNTTLVRYRDFYWAFKGNFAYNKNYITETLIKSPDELGVRSRGGGGREMVEGYSVGAYFGYIFDGIDPATGHTLAVDDEGKSMDMDLLTNVTLGLKPPTARYLGEAVPPYIGGFTNELGYKNLSLTMSFEFRLGHIIPSFNNFRGLDSHNRHISDITRWRAPGDQAQIPSVSVISPAFSKYEFDANFEKGDYLRMTFITLGYNVPSKWIQRTALNTARFTLSARNLFTITKYEGIDPSLNGSFGYPNTPELNLSVNLGF